MNYPDHEVQLSRSDSKTLEPQSLPQSYQQQSPNNNELGPGISKILEHQRRENDDGYPMQQRTRILYALLGVVLLCIYFTLLKRHFFEKHGIVVPSFSDGEENLQGTLRLDQSAIELEGKSHKKKKDKKLWFTHEDQCDDDDYSKKTLKRAYELPFAAIFKDTKGEKKWEASSITMVNNTAYAICDNSWAISKFGDDLRPFSPENKQIGDPNREEDDSGYEALFYEGGTFYVVRESVLHEDDDEDKGTYHAIIEELALGEDDYEVLSTCSSEFEFEGDSKGFEGMLSFRDGSGELVIMGLCEGNHCSESRKFDRGHGRFVAMKKSVKDDGSCVWETIRTIKLPKSAYFKDYSAAAMDEKGRVAISSQEDSAIWIGQLSGFDSDNGTWDLEKLAFDPDEGEIFPFPKSDDCKTVYCNIEGISWINDEMIIAVSDKMKSGGKQDFRCFDKDQSVHVFVLP